MKKQLMVVAAIVFAAAVSHADVARAACEKLLPSKVKACEGSDFCGIWGESKWNGILPHCLAVEGSSGNLRAIYAWGTAHQWNIRSPGWERVKARAEGDVLKMTLGNGAKVEYKMTEGWLHGTYRLRSKATIVLDRLSQ